jgi:hypothetical protein
MYRSTAKPLVPKSSHFELEIAVVTLQRHKSPGSDQIPVERIAAGGEIAHVLRSTFSLILFGIRKEVFYYCTYLLTLIIIKAHQLSTSYNILSSILLTSLTPCVDESSGIISVFFGVINKHLINFICL